jgi:hypothetical protein
MLTKLAASFALVLACVLAAAPAGAQEKDKKKAEAPLVAPREGKSETVALFDGKSFDGWEGDIEKYWSIKDGVIIARNTTPVKVSTYLVTKRKFTDFRLVFSAKLVQSEMHSGIAIWGRIAPEKGDPWTYQGHLVMFPSGYGLWDLHRRNGLSGDVGGVARKNGRQHDWNDMEILAQGNRIRFVINGVLALDWRDPKPELVAEGPIGLQLHSNNVPQEIHFKGLTLETFPENKLKTVK